MLFKVRIFDGHCKISLLEVLIPSVTLAQLAHTIQRVVTSMRNVELSFCGSMLCKNIL